MIGTQNIGAGRAAWLESVQENATYGIAFEAGLVRGFAEGEMGWAVDEPSIVLPDGTRLTARMTAVLRREEDGVLRLVHQHYSWAVPDEVGMASAQACASNSVSAFPSDPEPSRGSRLALWTPKRAGGQSRSARSWRRRACVWLPTKPMPRISMVLPCPLRPS